MTCLIKLIDKKKFAEAALNKNIEVVTANIIKLAVKMMINLAKNI